MSGEIAFYAAASAAVILVGLSKGGFAGLGNLAMPLLTLAVSPVTAAAILLPVLIVQDWVGVWAFRREFHARSLTILLPAGFLGVILGWALAAHVSEAGVRLLVGVISIVFVVFMMARDRFQSDAPIPAAIAPGFIWGTISGFTSMVSHAGGPPFMVYLLPQRLPPPVFAGTGTIFFAAVNLMKVIPFFFLGQFGKNNLLISANLVPVAILATFAGVWLIRKISAERFYPIILALTFLIGSKLIFDGVVALMA